MFALYCLCSKASLFLDYDGYSPLYVEHFRLPASTNVFDALTEAEWRRSISIGAMCIQDRVDLQYFLHGIFDQEWSEAGNHCHLSPFGRHIVICALALKVRDAMRLPLLFDTLSSYTSADLTSLHLREQFLRSLEILHGCLQPRGQYFCIDEPQSTMDIQSLLLTSYLEISFLYSAANEKSNEISDNHRRAVVSALEPLEHILRQGCYVVRHLPVGHMLCSYQ